MSLPCPLGTIYLPISEESSLPPESEVPVNLYCHPYHQQETTFLLLESELGNFWNSCCLPQCALTRILTALNLSQRIQVKNDELALNNGTSNSVLILHYICYYLCFRILKYLLHAFCSEFIAEFSERDIFTIFTLISEITKYGNKRLCFY